MKPKVVILPLCLFTLAFLGVRQSADLYRQSAATYFNQANLGSDDFRRMQPGTYVMEQLRTDAEQTGLSPGELLAIRLPFEHFCFGSGRAWTAARYEAWRMLFFQKNQSGYERVCQAYAAVWDDVRCFPVSAPGACYENSWMFERTYGGQRGHEGTDLMPPENIAGYYPVMSMTDGVVEKIGWIRKAAGGSEYEVRRADTFIMRILTPTAEAMVSVTASAPERFLVQWAIPGMARKDRAENLQCICILEFISTQKNTRN